MVSIFKSKECHSHTLFERGVNPLVSQRPNDVCQGPCTNWVDLLCHIHNLHDIKLGNNAKVVFL